MVANPEEPFQIVERRQRGRPPIHEARPIRKVVYLNADEERALKEIGLALDRTASYMMRKFIVDGIRRITREEE